MRQTKQVVILLNITLTIILTVLLKSSILVDGRHIVSQYYAPTGADERNFLLTDLELSALDHLNYGPFTLTPSCEVTSAHRYADYSMKNLRLHTIGNMETLRRLKQKHRQLKVFMTIGGSKHSERFFSCTKSQEKRLKMIRSIILMMKIHNFHGVDFDWEFPTTTPLGQKGDFVNFLKLIKETRKLMDIQGKNRMITLTGSIEKHVIRHMAPLMLQIAEQVDYLNLMAFEYSSLGHKTCLNAPLREEHPACKELDIESTLDHYLRSGFPSHKIILGLSAYSRGITGTNGLYKNKTGKMTGVFEQGIISYTDIKNFYLEKNGWIKREMNGMPYLYNPNLKALITYDDEKSILMKTRFALRNQLAGVFIYEASDDIENEFVLLARMEMNKEMQIEPMEDMTMEMRNMQKRHDEYPLGVQKVPTLKKWVIRKKAEQHQQEMVGPFGVDDVENEYSQELENEMTLHYPRTLVSEWKPRVSPYDLDTIDDNVFFSEYH